MCLGRFNGRCNLQPDEGGLRMKAPIFRSSPEDAIQRRIVSAMELRRWFVRETHGNAFQKGFPDLFCWHATYGLRWIDCKVPARFKYTKAQVIQWPKWEAGGVGVWVMFADSEEEYGKLFKPHNFRDYWQPRYDKIKEDPEASEPTFQTEEWYIQQDVIAAMEEAGWFVRETHGNAYQKGYPDLFCWHPVHGMRWIDCKNPDEHKYTKAQCQEWPKWEAGGVGVWIVFDPSQIDWLHKPANFRDYWIPSYDKYNQPIPTVISEIRE